MTKLLLALLAAVLFSGDANASLRAVSTTGALSAQGIVVYTPADNTCTTDESTALQAFLNANKSNGKEINFRPGDCILLTTAVTYPTGTSNEIVINLNGATIKHANSNKAFNFLNTGNATGPHAVSSLSQVTVNTDDTVGRITFSSTPAGLARDKWGMVVANNMLLAEGTVNIATMTAANPLQFTTTRAGGVVNGDIVHLEYIEGMVEADDVSCTIGSSSGVTDTSFTCTNIDGTGYTAYTANSGFMTETLSDQGWLGQGFQVMEAAATTVDLYNNIYHLSRYTDNTSVYVPDHTNKLVIKNGRFEAYGDPYDTGITTRNDAIYAAGFVNPVFENLEFVNPWKGGLFTVANFGQKVDNITCRGGINDSSVQALTYCFTIGGPTTGSDIGKVTQYQGRHGITTYTAQGVSFTSSNWYTYGYNVSNTVDQVTCHNQAGACSDTHEPTIDLTVNSVSCENMMEGPEDGGSASCVADRAVDSKYGTAICNGFRNCIVKQGIEHGLYDRLRISSLSCKGRDQDDTLDSCVNIDDQTGILYKPAIDISNWNATKVGKVFLIEEYGVMNIGPGSAQDIDWIGDVYGGATANVYGSTSYDFRNSSKAAAHTVWALRSDATAGGSTVRHSGCMTIFKGNAANKPTEVFNEIDTTATKYYYAPCIHETNESGTTLTSLLESGATTLSPLTNTSEYYGSRFRAKVPSGRYLVGPTGTSISTGNGTADVLYLVPFHVPERQTFTDIGFSTVVVTNGLYKTGIYRELNGRATGSPITGTTVTSGSITTGSATQQNNTFSSAVTLDPGNYFMGIVPAVTGTMNLTSSFTYSPFVGSTDTQGYTGRISYTSAGLYTAGLIDLTNISLTYTDGSGSPLLGLKAQ